MLGAWAKVLISTMAQANFDLSIYKIVQCYDSDKFKYQKKCTTLMTYMHFKVIYSCV